MSAYGEASKNTFVYVIVSIFLVVAAAIGAVAFYLKDTRGDIGASEEIRVSVEADGSTSETLSVENLRLLPAGSAEYSVSLSCEESGTYLFRLAFEEKTSSALKKYVYVSVLDGETALAEVLLKEAFDGEALTFEREMEAGKESKIVIRYAMSRDAGNDAQGAEADFDVLLTAQKR